MKRLFALILMISMLLGLIACGSSAPANSGTEAGATEGNTATFMAGYGKVDITPEDTSGVPMNGFASSSERLSTGLLSYLYSIAVAVQDADGNLAVMVSLDHAALAEIIFQDVQRWAEEKMGIPKENLLVSSIFSGASACSK